MSKKNKKSKSKKNNKKRLAIILSSILGTGILATAITLPIVLTRKNNKNGGESGEDTSFLDHFSKEITDISDLTSMDPHLDIFKTLKLKASTLYHTNITFSLVSSLLSDYDSKKAQEKMEEFVKYLLFQNAVYLAMENICDAFTGKTTKIGLDNLSVDYKLDKFSLEFSGNKSDSWINFSFQSTSTFTFTLEIDWGKKFGDKPDGYLTKAYYVYTITNKSIDDRPDKKLQLLANLQTGRDPILPNSNLKDDIPKVLDFNWVAGSTKNNSAPSAIVTVTNEKTGKIIELTSTDPAEFGTKWMAPLVTVFDTDQEYAAPFKDVLDYSV